MKKPLFILFFGLAVLHAQENYININKHGQLKIILHVDLNSYYIIVDRNFENYKEINKDSIITLPVGQHELTIVSKNYVDYSFNVNIEEGKTEIHRSSVMREIIDKNMYKESSYHWVTSKVNVVIYTDDDSELFINGESLGKGSTIKDLPNGKHKIESKNTLAGNSSSIVNINSKQLKTISIYNRPEKSWSQLLSFFPGASQIYKGQTIRGYMYIGLTAACIAMAVKYQVSYVDNNYIYEQYKELYASGNNNSAIINGEIVYPILENAKKAQDYYDLAKKDALTRDVFIYTTVGMYIINILDALLIEPAGGYRQANDKNILPGFSMDLGRNKIGINYTINF
jgi:hypothetical protein